MAKITLYTFLALILLVPPGCGGGGGGGSPAPLPMNKAIILSANLAPGLTGTSQPIKAIEVTFTLPAAASVIHTNGALLIGETGLKNLNNNGSVPSGSYDSATGTVHFILLPTNIATTDLGTGDIARLTYETTSGAELSPQGIQPVYKVSGPGSVDISNEIVPSVRTVTYVKP